jgi:hypothetical protein
MTIDLGDRMSALEARVAALEAGKLAPKKLAPRPPVDEGVRISYPTAKPSDALLPTPAQLAQLRSIVLRHRPDLAPSTGGKYADMDKAEFDRGFEGAVRWLASAGRSTEINYRHYLSHWIDEAERYLASLGTPETIRGNALMAAVLAWGVSYVENDNHGNVAALGLATYGGRPPTEATWKRVLESRQILQPTPGRYAHQPHVVHGG